MKGGSEGSGRSCGVDGSPGIGGSYRLKGPTIANELRPQVELYAVVEIIQPGPEVARQAECLQILEPARAPVVGRQNGVAAPEIAAWGEDGGDGAVQRGGADHIDPRSRQRIHLHDVESVALNCEIAGDGHHAGRSNRPGNEDTAGVDDGRAHGAAAEEYGTAVHDRLARPRDRAVHDQRAGIHNGRPGVGIGAGERQYSGAHLDQGTARSARGAAVANRPANRGAEIVAADDERVRAEEVGPSARNRASNHRGQGQTRHVEYATCLGGERGIAAAAELGEQRGATGIGDDRRIARRAKAAELRSSTEIGGDGRVARGAELGKLGRAADVGDDGRVAGSAGIGESREAGEVGRDGRVARRAAVAESGGSEGVVADVRIAGRSRAEECEEPAAIAGDGRVARRAGIVEAGESEIGVDDGGVAGRARIEKVCHRGKATGVVGDDGVAGRAVIGERQRRYGPHEEIRGIRRGIDDAGASNGEGCRAAEGK